MLRRERFSGQRPRLAARLVVARVGGLSRLSLCGWAVLTQDTRAGWVELSWGVAGGDAAKARRKDASSNEALSHSPACAASPARHSPSHRRPPCPVCPLTRTLQQSSRTSSCSTPGSIAASTPSTLQPLRCPCVGSATGCPYLVRAWTCLLSAYPGASPKLNSRPACVRQRAIDRRDWLT